MNRRKFIAGAGGIGAATVGGAALFAGSSAASSMEITAADAAVATDDGAVNEVSVAPELSVEWSGFDETVSRLRVLVQARHGSGDYHPVFRSTPWLDGDQAGDLGWEPGTSGSAYLADPVFGVRGAGSDFDENARAPIVIANDIGVPDYEAVAASAGGSVSEESYVEGTSVGTPTEYGEIVNHTHDTDENWKFGYYGAAANVEDFDRAADGETTSIPMDLRYIVTLHTSDTYTPLAMFDEYDTEVAGNHDADSIPHSALAVSDGHPAINVQEVSFDVHAENIQATSDVGGDSNTGAE